MAVAGLAGVGLAGAVVATRDPIDPLSILAVIVGGSVAIAASATLVALWLEERWSGVGARRRDAHRLRALRRGAGIGVVVAALALLRAVDGLTVITGGFVVAGFALAELVLGARRTARSG